MRTARPLDIAIVGMGCRFPGAKNLAAFWENILSGRDCTSEVPNDRWDSAIFVDPNSRASDRVASSRAGYLDAPIEFDPSRHGIMPLTVEGGEPEQFLVLDAASAALDDAGLTEGIDDGRRVEVVIGRGNYFNRGNLTRLQHGRVLAQTLNLLRELHPEWTDEDFEAIRQDLRSSLPRFEPATIPGQVTNATAGRLANRFDLSGASFVVDAASASSLVALDLGSRALVERRADMALVGGVYIGCDVDFPMVFSQLGALSKTGKARPFAKDADGTVPGEGVGVVVLKRLADAEREGNRVYAVIKGVGLASDGKGRSLAAPSALGHARAIRRAYRRGGVDPASVGFVEGHGLGVPASDRAELRALNAAFPPTRWGRRSLGAISAQIGHAMPAAGMAGLIKAALALHHRVIPPGPPADDLHELLADESSAFAINRSARPWIQGDRANPRRAGVNAFGFAGISGHAVLEEHSASADGPEPGPQPKWDSEAILLAGLDRADWLERAGRLLAWLERAENRAVPIKDLAYTLNTDFNAGSFRVGLVVASAEMLKDRLQGVVKRLVDPKCRSIRDARGVYFWEEPLGGPGRLAFLFPGEGSQYPGMLADLCPHFPEVRKLFDTSDRIAMEQGRERLPSDILFGPNAQDDEGLWEVGAAVNVVLSAQWGIHHLLQGLGLKPDAVVGHSSGEFLALASAGVVDVDTDLENRLGSLGKIFEHLDRSGQVPAATLAAVASSREKVQDICNQVGATVTVAMDNCPHQVVLAGSPEQVESVLVALKEQGIVCEILPFARAYHTEAFTPALPPIEAFFRELTLKAPTSRFYSCASGRRVTGDVQEIRSLAVQQWATPVAFRPAIESMYDDGVRLFVDVGPRGNLSGFVEDTLRGRPHFAIASQLPRRSGLTQLNHLVSSLFAQGVPLTPEHLYKRRQPRRIDLGLDLPAVRPAPALAVGFPEMRFSPELATSLRERNKPANPVVINGPVFKIPKPEPAHLNGTNGKPHETPPPVSVAYTNGNGSALNGHAKSLITVPAASRPSTPRAGMMMTHLKTMDDFLETQRQLMGAFQAQRQRTPTQRPQSVIPQTQPRNHVHQEKAPEIAREPSPRPAEAIKAVVSPWVGTLVSFVPGHSLVAERWLEAQGDPVAENHTLGGRRVSALDPTRKGLPVVPFTVMAEILAQAAAPLLPGMVVTALRDVQANRWIRYEQEPVKLEVRARRDEARPDEVKVQLFNRAPGATSRVGGDIPVVEGRVIFSASRPGGTIASPFHLTDARHCRFGGPDIYEEQWLFHGPALQAVTQIGEASPHGIEGTLRILPRRGLLRPNESLSFHTDPIVLDAFTHLLGCWGLDQVPWGEGDVIFPLRVAELAIPGFDPGEGAEVACRIWIREASRHKVMVDAQLVAPDGRVWVEIKGWEDWRFYWPSRFRDQFRQPNRVFVGEALSLPQGPPQIPSTVQAVWLQPPGDMAKPVWRDVFEWVQLGPDERLSLREQSRGEEAFTHRLWENVAAKEAVRRLWLAEGKAPVYPGDLRIDRNEDEQPRFRSLLDPNAAAAPSIAVAHAEGVAIALASLDPAVHLGLAIEALAPASEELLPVELDANELATLKAAGVDIDEWSYRLRAAKDALARAARLDSARGRRILRLLRVEPSSGIITLDSAIEIGTERRGDYVWAWAIAK